VVPNPDDPAERAAVVALDVITSAERTALEREREANERVRAAANVIRRMRTDVADLFNRVDQQIAELEQTLPGADGDHPMAPVLEAHQGDGELVGELRRYELSVLSASQRTADHLREVAKADAEELLTAARAEEDAIRQRIAELQAVEERLLGAVRDGLSDTPAPPAAPPPAITNPHRNGSVDPARHGGADPERHGGADPARHGGLDAVHNGSADPEHNGRVDAGSDGAPDAAGNGYPGGYESERQAFG
jgi:hypothetical protein